MKNMIKLPAMLVGLMLLFAGTTQTAKAQQEDVSLQSFYDELSPYGTWIQDPQYGYVWRPDVDQEDFRPYYSNGRWAMTEYGNTWVSNYEWGWAPFHYGRWVYNRYNQWIWLPDTVWGPAWVSWRSGGGYYGWAPLGPSINIGINIGRGGYRVPDMCWNFIPYQNIYYSNYPRYASGRNRVYIQNTVIINNTYIRNNRTYYTGPRADDIRRRTNQNVTVYNVNRSSRPGSSRIENNSVNIYSPRPGRGQSNANAAPKNPVRGDINRETIGRGEAGGGRPGRTEAVGNGNANTRPSRGSVAENGMSNGANNGRFDNPRGDNRNAEGATRPSRANGTTNEAERNGNMPRAGRPNSDNVDRSATRPNVFERNREGMENQAGRNTSASPQAQPRVERNREMPQRAERTERQQAPQQRAERPQGQQPQRVERTQSAPQQRGSGNESRGGGRGETGGGRPGRG